MEKFIKQKTVKPQEIEIGNSIEVHADVIATFKTYVSRFNKDKDEKIRFDYAPFVGSFCKATRKENEIVTIT